MILSEDTLKKLGFIAAYEFLFGTDEYMVAESVTDAVEEYSEWQEFKEENDKKIETYKQIFINSFNKVATIDLSSATASYYNPLECSKGGILMNTEFAYKVSPAAKLAHDAEGNAAPAFVKIKIGVSEEYATTKYNEAQLRLIPFVAKQAMTSECHIQPISIEVYEAEHKEE
ncbi:hypothetical protein J1907_10135 [Lysinibacillus sphaericus]|uniref:hypothetical protein n=1 Tax=Lysinibacillus sphaericus TaxID=1421 RepID=UPI00056D7FAC|nr:hypothetical protein [Lysinibacillus sphaericus]MBG9754930.1 hypothetical protein [Lysinibacillus sphaericus]QTB15435.1 hypothetical protein J2B92_09715 [Lysinibacillus sphaericus]QTB24368.1 hypothetical protein J1907_10135 [Lysinibacillus sphaericus]